MTEMHVLVGRGLSGATLAGVDEAGGLGRPTWDPLRLLSDLELRLGLCADPVSPLVRAAAVSARMAATDGDRFYSRSHRVDPLGTAQALLDWRDHLVLAGWDGRPIAGGGDRLEALAELESMAGPLVPAGLADRVRAVESALARADAPLYGVVALVDDLPRWPLRWRRILGRLASAGTAIRRGDGDELGGGAPGDLGVLQSSIAAPERPADRPGRLAGDGSVTVLRASTSTEAAQATAAILARWGTADSVLVSGGAAAILDAALAVQGLAPAGTATASEARPALQLLPLAIELVFAPRDPHRVLDLLTAPIGPFRRITRRILSRALVESPGLGGPAWRRAKDEVRERLLAAQPVADEPGGTAGHAARQIELVETWLEGSTHDDVVGAPADALAATARRVAAWARARLARTPDEPAALAVHRQAEAFVAALSIDPRRRLDRAAARDLVVRASRAVAIHADPPRAGRVDAVDDPGALLCRRGTVVWWHFVDSRAREWRAPWRASERGALAAAGVELADPAEEVAALAAAWRLPLRRAVRRLVLVIPDTSMGEPLDPHPLWRDLLAGLGAADLARVTVSARALLAGRARLDPSPAVETVAPLPLPAPRAAWTVPAGALPPVGHHSAGSLNTLISCPLQFVLAHAAGLRSARTLAISPPFVLAGNLGHRLVEELFREGALAGGAGELARRAGDIFERLVDEEASPLLAPGASFERRQLRRQLVAAVVALADMVARRGWTLRGVEVPAQTPWRGGTLTGRIDVLAGRADGGEVVLDLKWGRRRYRQLLDEGRAVQLAIYAHLRRAARGGSPDPVDAGYFSLSRAEMLAGGSFSPAAMWPLVERTAVAVEVSLEAGRIPATGVADAPALADALGVPDLVPVPNGAGCEHCDHDALCGRRWERLS